MWLRASCSLRFDVPTPTPFVFMLRPRSGSQQWVGRDAYVTTPSVGATEYTDLYGNLCQRLVAPAGPFSVRSEIDVDVPESSDVATGAPFVEVHLLPVEVLPFVLPSRFCESDRFTDMAAGLTTGCQPGYDQCIAIIDYLRATIRYTPGAGGDIISATEVNERSDAVCRDLAHLGIALCRALSIPSRMVVGYLETLRPLDLHAWFEVFVGGRWYTMDPTQPDLGGGRVAVAYGRDAADVAIYTQFGDPVTLQGLEVAVERLASPPS
jgi:transglutaminase-like putative cysteine protease